MITHYDLDFVLEGQTFKINPKRVGPDVIFYADGGKLSDREAKKEQIELILTSHSIPFKSETITALTGTLESTIFNYKGMRCRFGYKPKQGSGGSGAGTELTTITESAQAIYCAAAQLAKGNPIDHGFVAINLEKFKTGFIIDASAEKVIAELDKSWQVSCALVAKKLQPFLKNGSWVFHRGSPLIKQLEAKFIQLNRKYANRFKNINKWNPADIYAIRRGFSLDTTNITSVEELNEYLVEQIDNVLPISLKKVKTHVNAKWSIEPTHVEFVNFTLSSRGRSILSSKDVMMMIKEGNQNIPVQFRSFTQNKHWGGEVKGKGASHGKVGHGPINTYLKVVGNKQLPTIPAMTSRALKKDPILLKDIWELANQLGTAGISEKEFFKEAPLRGTDWAFSMWFNLQFLAIFKSMTKSKRDSFVTLMFKHAKSERQDSALFLKVSES